MGGRQTTVNGRQRLSNRTTHRMVIEISLPSWWNGRNPKPACRRQARTPKRTALMAQFNLPTFNNNDATRHHGYSTWRVRCDALSRTAGQSDNILAEARTLREKARGDSNRQILKNTFENLKSVTKKILKLNLHFNVIYIKEIFL